MKTILGTSARSARNAVAALFASVLALGAQAAESCGTTTWALTAGQHINVGTVTVSNDLDNIYITYALTDPTATFGTLHAWVGNDLLNVPANNQGTPVPGKFPYKPDATGLTSYTITVPFSDLELVDAAFACGMQLYVVTHAEVNRDGDGDGEIENETAFGGDQTGGGNRWWFYGKYTVCCDFGPPPVLSCETAYGKGGFVFTTNKKSNPEKLPSLALTQNRWGWATNLTAPGSVTSPMWAGAGLNNTANGTNVGNVTVSWNGTTATVTYNVSTGYMSEAHVYVGDTKPTTIAPGQYGNTAHLADGTTTHSVTVDVSDTNGDGIWVVAHAVSCFEQ